MNYVFFCCMLLLYIVTHGASHRKHREKAYHSLYKKSKNLKARQQVVAPPTSTNGNFDLMQENEKLIDNNLYRRDDVDVFNQFNNDAPILWNGDLKQQKQGPPGTANAVSRGQVSKHGTKKDGGMGDVDEGDFPSTALQNPNIFGGFPENDIWGNFELPASETLDKLKSSLKVNHHKPNYGAEDGSDSISELYGYEHHALPEYDILETPQFHETPQGQKVLEDIASSNGGGCPGMGSCPPITAKIACQNIQTTCNDKEESSQAVHYESPCAAKILSLFGCKLDEKVDAPVEPLQQTSLSESPKEETKTEAKLEDKPELKLEAKIDSKLDAKPDVKIEAKPETKIDVKVASKPEAKLNPKEDSKPEAKLEPKGDSKPEAKLESMQDSKPEAKPELKEDSKPEAKIDPKGDSKPEAKVESKGDSKPEAKLEHKDEATTEPKPESAKDGTQHHEEQALSSETLFKSPNLEISLDDTKKHKTENSVAKLLSALRNSPSFQKTPIKSFSDDSANKEQSQEVLDGVGLKNDDESLTLGLMQDIGNDLQKTLTEKFDKDNDKNSTEADLPFNKKEGETDSTASITEKLPTVNDVTNDNKELKSYFQSVTSEPSKQQQKEIQQTEVHGNDQSHFSDWSFWSTCSGCEVGMKTRRRNCLKVVCGGSTEETSPCSKKCHTDVVKPIILNNASPDNQLIEALQPAQSAIPSNQTVESAILSNQTAQPTSSQGNFAQPQSTTNQPMGSSNSVATQHQLMINQSVLPYSTAGAMTQLNPLTNQSEDAVKQLSSLTNQSEESDDVRKQFEQLVLNKTFESVVNTFTKQLNESMKPDTQSIKTNDNVLIPPSQQSTLQYNVKPATDKQLFEILSNKAFVTEDTNLKPDIKMPHLIEQNIDSTRIILLNKGEDKNKINEYKSSSWGEWSECSMGCGIGIKSRTKTCDVKSCSGEVVQTKPCHVKTCEDPELESSIKGGCLKLHNELRDRHGAAGLEWSDALYKKAHEITERIAVNSIPQKNLSQYERPGLNLNFVELNPSNNRSLDGPCLKAVSEWYGEKLNYDYETPKLTSEDRDFTQLVWKSTKRVGLARSLSPDGRNAYIAAVYEPIGNVDSFYDKKNELPVTPRERTNTFLNLRVGTKRKKSKIVKNG